MTRILVVIAGVLVLAGLVVGFAGFEAPPPPPAYANSTASADPSEAHGPRPLRYVVPEDCITLNPQGTSSLTDFRVITCLFEGLLNTDARDLSLTPGVAKSMPNVSEDGRVYTFHLRPDARWSNGDPVTAHDFVFSWRRAVMPDFAAVYSGLFYVIEGAQDFYTFREEQLENYDPDQHSPQLLWDEAMQRFDDTVGIQALDDHTLRVTLINPTAYFASLTTFGTLAPNHTATVEKLITLDPRTGRANFDGTYFTEADRLISNGPFQLTQWQSRRRLVLDANPHYWDRDALQTTRIVQTVIGDNDPLRVVRYLDGDFDWVPNLDADLALRLMAAGREDTVGVPRAGLEYYAFNVRDEVDGKKNPLADVRVRRALAMSVDKQGLVEHVTRLGEPVAHTFVPQGAVRGYDPPAEADPGYDPQAARDLLAEAGYPDGQGFPTLRLLFNTSGSRQRLAVRIANQWRENLSIEVATENYEWRTYLDKRRKGEFHVARSGWYGDYQDPTTWLDLLRGDDPNNATGYESDAFDGLLKQAAREVDPDKRLAILRDAEQTLLEDHVIVPLYQALSVDLVAPYVQDLHQNAWNNMNLDQAKVLPTDAP